jgi:cholesterol transport system auxiliary component
MMRQKVFATLILLSGCTGSLLDSKIPVPTIYVLAAAPAGDGATTAALVDLAVSQPTTAPGLDTERIAVLREARRLDYYREAQWGAALPQVAQSFVVGSLQNQKIFRSVTTEQARVTANYLLDLEVRDFQAEYPNESSAPTVRVTFIGSLIRIKDRKLISVLSATITVPTSENRLGSVIEAFESAGQQAAVSLSKQTAAAIADSSTN